MRAARALFATLAASLLDLESSPLVKDIETTGIVHWQSAQFFIAFARDWAIILFALAPCATHRSVLASILVLLVAWAILLQRYACFFLLAVWLPVGAILVRPALFLRVFIAVNWARCVSAGLALVVTASTPPATLEARSAHRI
jgi:hypothetical protein